MRPKRNSKNSMKAWSRERILLLLSVVAPLLFSCGIENIPYLMPPDLLPQPSSDKLHFGASFLHDQTEFQGFELYYKFYTTFSEEIDTGLSTYESLSASGFHRVNSATDTRDQIDRPLIFINLDARGTDYSVSIDFSDEPKISSTLNPFYFTDIYIRRDVLEGDDLIVEQPYKSFLDVDIDDSDLDNVREELLAGTWNDLTVAIYVLSYGIMDFVNPIHSEPLYLGKVELPPVQL